jgi:hypothetical protein
MTRYVPGRQNIWIAEIDLMNPAKNTSPRQAQCRRPALDGVGRCDVDKCGFIATKRLLLM